MFKLYNATDSGNAGGVIQPDWEGAFDNTPAFFEAARRFRHAAWQCFSVGDLLGVLRIFEGYSSVSARVGQDPQLVLEYERGLIHIGNLIVELLFVQDRIEEVYRHSATFFQMLDSVLNLPADAGWEQYGQAYQCICWSCKEISCVKLYDNEKLRDRVIKPEGILVLYHEAAARYFMLESACHAGKHIREGDLLLYKELFIWMFMPVCAMAYRYCRDKHSQCVQLYNSVAGAVLAPEPFHFRENAPPQDANHMYWWHQKIISALAGGLTLEERRRCTEQMLKRENWLRNPTAHDLAYVAAHDRHIDSLILRQSGLELV